MYPTKLVYQICLASLAIGSFCLPTLPLEAKTEMLSYGIEDKDEAFLVRRIAEFWKDQDYSLVKSQIVDFLAKYPNSTICDHLLGILGDLYLQENDYDKALATYIMIKDPEINDQILLNKLQCLYEKNSFLAMIVEGTPHLTKENKNLSLRLDEFHFLMGEAYFRAALASEDQSKKNSYLTSAAPLYEKILDSSFSDPTMFALAEIYRQKNENQKAAAFFSELSQRHPELKEELLFHAALAQAEFDKALAIETFAKVVDKGGNRASEAALNRMILFFQEERYSEVIHQSTKVVQNVPAEKAPLLYFIIGKSYFATNDFTNASEWLEKCIYQTNGKTEELHSAYLMQLSSLQNLKMEASYESILSKFKVDFPEDKELPKAIFIHAMMQKDGGNFQGCENNLAELIQKFPEYEDREGLYLEYSLASFKNENWKQSYTTLVLFLKQFPHSSHQKVAWKHLLASSINLLSLAENDPSIGYTKANFYDDLSLVLSQNDVLASSERCDCLFLQGKVAYELGKYTDALRELSEYLVLYPSEAASGESHLLIALAHHKLGDNPTLFCEHAEKALQNNPELQNRTNLHLELFNTYLSLIQESGVSFDSPLYDLAGEHLFEAMRGEDLPINLENRLWLASFYYNKGLKEPELFEVDGDLPKDELEAYYKRSLFLYEGAVIQKTTGRLILIEKDQAFFEWEVMKLANLYGRSGLQEKKLNLLKDLIEQQNTHSTWNWKLRKESLLELAKTYELIGNRESAFETLAFIATHFQKESAFASEYASLHADRLKFALIAKDRRIGENSEVPSILNDLKEFQIRKSAHSEPLHLESALEYAWIRAQLADDGDEAMRYLFFLSRIKEDYANMQDPMVSSYHKELAQNRSKELLYNAYMEFLEAEIKRCESVLALKENNTKEGNELMDESRKMLTSISEKTSSFYLKERAKTSLSALKKSKIL